MTLYRSLANAIGTSEAMALGHRLGMWHDAMVVHLRRAGASRTKRCEVDCPHVQAESLWLEALELYGERAHGLGFLRTYGRPARQTRQPAFVQMEA